MGTPARAGPILSLEPALSASAFVRQNAELLARRRLEILQSGDHPDVLRLMAHLDTLVAQEQAARGWLSDDAKAVETMSDADLDAYIAAHGHLPTTCPHCGMPLDQEHEE